MRLIGRALRELGIVWIAAHSPQAKGRIERSFATAQDRLVKGLRVAGANTLEQANRYLDQEFLPWWNQHLKVLPANPTDAHRPLEAEHNLSAALSCVETRQVANDYSIRFGGKLYQIARQEVRPGMRGGTVRLEARLDGTLAVRFQDRYVAVSQCQPPPKITAKAPPPLRPRQPHAQPNPAIRQAVRPRNGQPSPARIPRKKVTQGRGAAPPRLFLRGQGWAARQPSRAGLRFAALTLDGTWPRRRTDS